MCRKSILGGSLLLALALGACGRSTPTAMVATPTQSSDQMATGFFQTLNAPSPTSTASQTPSGPTDTPVPSATPTGAATVAPTTAPLPQPPTGSGGCTLQASFVKDVTVPDGTKIAAGQKFTKTWQLKNSGTCTWTTDYKVVFYSGAQLGAPNSQTLGTQVAPGGTVSISIRMIAPTSNGSYKGEWLLSDPSGITFGTELSGIVPFWVQIVVGTAPTSTPSS